MLILIRSRIAVVEAYRPIYNLAAGRGYLTL